MRQSSHHDGTSSEPSTAVAVVVAICFVVVVVVIAPVVEVVPELVRLGSDGRADHHGGEREHALQKDLGFRGGGLNDYASIKREGWKVGRG